MRLFICLLLAFFSENLLQAQSSEIYLQDLPSDRPLDLSERSEILNLIHEKINRDDIKVEKVSPQILKLAEDEDLESFTFSKDGIPLCLEELKAIIANNTLTLLGQIPAVDQIFDEMPNSELSLETSWSALKEVSLQDPHVLNKRLCFFLQDHALYPVWEWTLQTEGLNFKVWSDEQKTYKVSKRFFEAQTAKIQTYLRDPVSNPSTNLFEETVDDQTLKNSFFLTDPSTNESGISRAESKDNTFLYNPDDALFDEASLFVHANEHLKYFNTLGYNWTGKLPITLKFHTLIGDTKNNAMYQPSDDGSALISIGDGDGVELKNLAKDADVVSHELGHHVIFNWIKESSGESLIVHEGLADYFVFAKNKDACLGHSICVAGDRDTCAVENQCLRTANETLLYNSNEYKTLGAHNKGQLISGFFYGLHKIMDPALVPKLVYNSLKYLVHDSGFKHLILASMLVDYQMNKGDHACQIYEAAKARGFGPLLKDIDCTKLERIRLIADPPPSPPAKISKKKKRGFLGCTGLANLPAEQFDVSCLLLIPFLRRRRSKTKV